MKKRPTIFLLALLVMAIFAGFSSCEKQEEIPNYDQLEILAPLVEDFIVPVHEDFVIAAQSLKDAGDTFASQPTQTHADQLRAAWLACMQSWKTCELFAIGESKQSFLHNKIGKWPINPLQINAILADSLPVTTAYIEGKGSTAQGLFALEWLIYPDSNANLLTLFTTDSLASRRSDMLRAYTDNILINGNKLNDLWSPSGDDYAYRFLFSRRSGINNPVSLFVNGEIQLLETVTKLKIGEPLGKFNLAGFPDPDRAEAARSGNSLSLIKKNMEILQGCFQGTNGSQILVSALDALTTEENANARLSSQIKAKFDECISRINAIPSPLEEAVLNSASTVEEAYESLKELLVLFRVDLSSALSITVTISDNDGD